METTKDYWLKNISKRELLTLGVRESSIYENIAPGMTQAELTEEQAQALIPKNTLYCYSHAGNKRICPFWDRLDSFPKQGNGYCHYLQQSDEALNGLLWDSCKSCGIGEDLID